MGEPIGLRADRCETWGVKCGLMSRGYSWSSCVCYVFGVFGMCLCVWYVWNVVCWRFVYVMSEGGKKLWDVRRRFILFDF